MSVPDSRGGGLVIPEWEPRRPPLLWWPGVRVVAGNRDAEAYRFGSRSFPTLEELVLRAGGVVV